MLCVRITINKEFKGKDKAMEDELLKIFNDDRQQIGVATREEVHEKGYWHETFHCWFLKQEKDELFLYLQLRSDRKKDYPNLLDITAAGHILATETIQDGIREINEEIGIDVAIEHLISLGTIDYCVVKENFIDKEIAHVYLYHSNHTLDDFHLQEEEVSGIVKVALNDFEQLWFGESDSIYIHGFKQEHREKRVPIDITVGKEMFVPHDVLFYQTVINRIKEALT